jgi:hypothetical protein
LESASKLLFWLEGFLDQAQVVALADAVLAWSVRHPEFKTLKSVFAKLLGDMMEPLARDVRVSGGEVRNMLVSRAYGTNVTSSE